MIRRPGLKGVSPHGLQSCAKPSTQWKPKSSRAVVGRSHGQKARSLIFRINRFGLHRSIEWQVSGGLEGWVYQDDEITKRSDNMLFAATKKGSRDALDKLLGNCRKQY